MITQNIIKKFKRFGYHLIKLDPSHISDSFVKMKELCHETESPVIFDVGAHHGQTTSVFRKIFPKARIYAFEPFETSYQILKTNTDIDKNVIALNIGLCAQEGNFSFHSNPNEQTNSLLATDRMASSTWGKGALETREIVQAKFSTLDSFIAGQSIPKINILKLDVQGAEHLVLKGAKYSCECKKIDILYTEVITLPTYEGQMRLDHTLSTIFDSGFDLHSIYNLSFTSTGKLRQFDAIFTRSA